MSGRVQQIDGYEIPTRLFIGGEWTHSVDGGTIETIDPSTEEPIASVEAAGPDDVGQAVQAARRSFEQGHWRGTGGFERAKVLWRIAELIDAHAERIAHIDVRDNGMPLKAARYLARLGAETFRYYAGWCSKITGLTTDIDSPGRKFHAYTIREPVGVAGLIVPWNAPFSVACNKLAPALAAGCSVVLKPAEETPLSALVLGDIVRDAGIPAGVVNIINGIGHEAGAALAQHPGVDKIAFTGSTDVGRKIIAAATGNIKKLSLELGGKSPAIVLPDADISATVDGLSLGAFMNSGQACIAGSRIYVHRRIYNEVTDALVAKSRSLHLGNGLADNVDLGPLISQGQLERVLGLVQSGIEDGAQILSGAHRLDCAGYFMQPTVMSAPRQGARILREEIFGPVANVIPFDDIDDVVERANETEFGLAAAVWTRDVGTAHSLAKRLNAGTIWLNCAMVTDRRMPFGGYKQSGWGRESGLEGLEPYLQTKTVFTAL